MGRQLHTLFFSPTDGTARVITAVTEGIGGDGVQHDVTLPAGRESTMAFGIDDVLVIGVPVYSGRVPALVADYLGSIQGEATYAVLVAVYGNRAFEDALLELRDICERRGFRCVAAGAFIAEHSMAADVGANRPDAADIEAARAFGAAVAAKLSAAENEALVGLDIPGNRPYRERSSLPVIGPETSGTCIKCGVCAERCPTGAINFDDFSTTDSELCILCGSCVKRCPVAAKSFAHPEYLQIVQRLRANLSAVRNEPVGFI